MATLRPAGHQAGDDALDTAVRSLRARGLRVSAARRLVLTALAAAERPLSAQDIAGGLGGRLPRSDVASVYRNLETLEQTGLARHLHPGRGASLYELSDRRGGAYLVCDRCNSVTPADAVAIAALAERVRAELRFEPHFAEFPIVGLCAVCASAADGDR
jgi:Fur family ferric uptake transcriptional regulator